ncbi:protein moonraker isoform X2 [Hemiscyllium ocellatum]|uniref:protein moonraker isoform X2 n=1 Tax=Hemiscyllium ocellatum TaxID=170820 RepID=UPI0029671496|nr:protein moonraker isoform X2 [Hemiscyllium ocellatum]
MATKIQHHQTQILNSAHSFGTWVPSVSAGQDVGRNVQSGSQFYKNQLKFNKDALSTVSNLAATVTEPRPIIIEKLRQPCDLHVQNDAQSMSNSVPFSSVSEERLNMAVRMAKRDLKKGHLEEQMKDYLYKLEQDQAETSKYINRVKGKSFENAAYVRNRLKMETLTKLKQQKNQTSKEGITKSSARVYICTSDQSQARPARTDSPPTHDPGPDLNRQNQGSKTAEEIRRLRTELSKYFQKIEELSKREKYTDILDPEEERRMQIKRQEQASRSARMLYVLQQQVNEIQEEIEKQSPHKIKHTKKSRAMSRLAAAHRGAVRALQMFVSQLSGQSEQQIPTYYKELGQLIRQLSLCSAKMESDMDASIPETIINILQQVEDLDSLLGSQLPQRKSNQLLQRARSVSPPNRKGPPGRHRSRSAERLQKPSITKHNVSYAQKQLPPLKTVQIDESSNVAESPRPQLCDRESLPIQEEQQQQEEGPLTPDRGTVLRAGLDALQRVGALKKSAMERKATKKGVLLPTRSYPRGQNNLEMQACFQKSTVSSELKRYQGPPKESRPPWIPGYPTCPLGPSKRIPWKKQKTKLESQKSKPADKSQICLFKEMEQERQEAANTEAIRLAWLDSETARRLREVNKLCIQETDRRKKLRAEADSPNKWIAKAEEEIREKLQPLLDKAQVISDSWEKRTRSKECSLQHQLSLQVAEKAAASVDLLSEKLLDELLEDTAHELLNLELNAKTHSEALMMQEGTTLENMLQRIEEMERYQEAVCRRICQIEYADPDFWAEEEKQEREFVLIDTKPHTPQPIRITRTVEQSEPTLDRITQKSLEADPAEDLELSGKPEPASLLEPLTQRLSRKRQNGIELSIPQKMFHHILDYRERFDQHLKMISHEAVGSFNPWLITESLAEELMDEGLSDVAAELQNVCEEYAEALFTSEFVPPVE